MEFINPLDLISDGTLFFPQEKKIKETRGDKPDSKL